MAELATRLANFLALVGTVATRQVLRLDDLRHPQGGPAVFRGSALGAALWSTPEGETLLDLVSTDSDVGAALGPHRDIRWECRMVLAGAAQAWRHSGMDAGPFAQSVEATLWKSLRRTDIDAVSVVIVEGMIAPPGGIELPFGRAVLPPDEQWLAWAFRAAWPEYDVYLPTQPYALFVSHLLAPRLLFGGVGGVAFGGIAADLIRWTVWLTTSVLPTLGHVVVWEADPFPVIPAQHFPPDKPWAPAHRALELAPHASQLRAMIHRLAVLWGEDHNPPELDPRTEATLQTIRDQASAALHSADSTLPLLLAFAAADGSLRERTEAQNVVPARFALLCESDKRERRHLRKMVAALDPVRDAIAHGDRPTIRKVSRFLGIASPVTDEDPETPWFPDPWDKSEGRLRARALDLLRRLFRAWLLATLEPADDQIRPGWTREELIGRLRAAQEGDIGCMRALEDRLSA